MADADDQGQDASWISRPGSRPVHLSRQESGDVTKGNNHWTRADFAAKAPGLDWATYFAGRRPGQGHPVRRVAAERDHRHRRTGRRASPIEAWKAYLTFHAIQSRAGVLPAALYQPRFLLLRAGHHRRHEAARPLEARRERHQRRARLRGRPALRRTVFPAPRKRRAPGDGREPDRGLQDRIDQLDWMSPATKAEAKAKLAVLKVGVGLSRLVAGLHRARGEAGDAYGNAERARLFQLAAQPRRSLTSRWTAASG